MDIKRRTHAAFLIWIFFLGSIAVGAFGQAISEEAQRYMVRGQTAFKMAKSPEDFELAVKEFQEAVKLAPDWPEAWYNLGFAQEKAEKLADAVASLKRFLELAPDDPEAAEVKKVIYELEYKAEQVLTVPDIVDILVSFDGEGWQSFYRDESGALQATISTSTNKKVEHRFSRVDDHSVRAGTKSWTSLDGEKYSYSILSVTGPIFVYTETAFWFNSNTGKYDKTTSYRYEYEVVSKTHVKEHVYGYEPPMAPYELIREYRKK
jgi:tetratricopeptide (TPR) repeat protein